MTEQILRGSSANAPPEEPPRTRRLMIICPVTGAPTDTGLELAAIDSSSTQWLVDCLECGQDHPWSIDDTFLE